MRLPGKRAIVTGAAGALGSAIAGALAAEGASVAGLDLNAAGLEATGQLVREQAQQFRSAAVDLTVHDADTIRFLLADEVVEVTALSASGGLGNGVVEDSGMGSMRTSRGPLVCFHDDFMVPHAGTGVEVHGSGGSLIARDVLLADPGGEVWLKRLGELTAISIDPVWPLYENVVNRFMAAVRGEGEPLTSGADGVASLAIALAVLESAEQGRPVTPSR